MPSFPVGGIIFWPSDSITAKPGWQDCAGEPAVGPDLISLLGNRFGTSPSGEPLVPKLAGLFLRGVLAGETPGTVQKSSFGSHKHGYKKFPTPTSSSMVGAANHTGVFNANASATTIGTSAQNQSAPLNLTQSPNETRAVNMYLHHWIATGEKTAAEDTDDRPAPVPIGSIIAWTGDFNSKVPDGWLRCEGQPCPSDATDLADFLKDNGSPFGNSGDTPYLPNLGGYFIRGVQDGTPNRGFDPDVGSRTAPRDKEHKQPGVGGIQEPCIVYHSHGYSKFPDIAGNACADRCDQKVTSSEDDVDSAAAGTDTLPCNMCLIHLIKKTADPETVALPVGSIIMYSGNANSLANLKNKGWLRCEGDPVPDAHKDLAGLLGGNCPDLQGLFVRCVDRDGTVDQDQATRFIFKDPSPTRTANKAVLSLQNSALQDHGHIISTAARAPLPSPNPNMRNPLQVPGGDYGVLTFMDMQYGWDQNGETTSWYPADPALGKETRPRNMALYFIISCGIGKQV